MRGSHLPQPASLSTSAAAVAPTWPERLAEHPACVMCRDDHAAVDIGWGLLVKRGVYGSAYLWRSGSVRGYVVVIWTGPHTAELTALDARQLTGFMNEVTAVGRAIEAYYRPAPALNVSLLANDIPHLHAHLIPRHPERHAPGRALPFAHLDHDRQDEYTLQSDAAALRGLLASTGTVRASIPGQPISTRAAIAHPPGSASTPVSPPNPRNDRP